MLLAVAPLLALGYNDEGEAGLRFGVVPGGEDARALGSHRELGVLGVDRLAHDLRCHHEMFQMIRELAERASIPVARIGLPEDIWLAVRFILECDYFNGRTIDVDGGLVM